MGYCDEYISSITIKINNLPTLLLWLQCRWYCTIFIQNRRISGSDRENANVFLSCIPRIDNTFLTFDEILFYFEKPFAYRLNRTEKRQKLNVIYDYKKKNNHKNQRNKFEYSRRNRRDRFTKKRINENCSSLKSVGEAEVKWFFLNKISAVCKKIKLYSPYIN